MAALAVGGGNQHQVLFAPAKTGKQPAGHEHLVVRVRRQQHQASAGWAQLLGRKPGGACQVRRMLPVTPRRTRGRINKVLAHSCHAPVGVRVTC
ncbi:hypothetical protein D3C79_866540 [compost metagenome]